MSVSSINSTTGSMAAAAATLQAQAVQYANNFNNLQNAVSSGNVKEAQKALASFTKDTAIASANGFDPMSQSTALRQDFSALKKAISIGDLRSAATTLSLLKKDLSTPVQKTSAAAKTSSDLQGLASAVNSGSADATKKALAAFSIDVALAATTPSSRNSAAAVVKDIRAIQSAISSGDSKATSIAFQKSWPELTSFAQSPLVFPTSENGAAQLSVSSSSQAVLQNMRTAVLQGQSNSADGTPFAPTPDMMLGSRGITIPPGAALNLSRTNSAEQIVNSAVLSAKIGANATAGANSAASAIPASAAVGANNSGNSGGTPFAPTPEMLLGSKGMTIPPGADLKISANPFLLKGLTIAS